MWNNITFISSSGVKNYKEIHVMFKTLNFLYILCNSIHLSRLNFPTHISRTSLFPTLGVLGAIFQFCSNSYRTLCEQTVETVASDLSLHCLPMSHKKDDRLI